jgi:hypothetical protein
MPKEEVNIAAIRLPYKIEKVSRNGNRTDRTVDQNISNHSYEDLRWYPHAPRLHHDVGGQGQTHRIAHSWGEPDQTIESEAKTDAGNAELAVEQARQALQPAKRTIARRD